MIKSPSYSRIFGLTKRCKRCNAKIFTTGFNPDDRIVKMMKRDGVCYECAYWQNVVNYPPSHMEILGVKAVRVFPMVEKKDKSMLLGGKGKVRHFVRRDMTQFKSNDVWTIGVIPEHFRELLPPTIVEIDAGVKRKLARHTKMCSARGCFDRYSCLRYNLELEQDEMGAYNKIPPAWKVGNEHCKDFINMHNITTDESSVGKQEST